MALLPEHYIVENLLKENPDFLSCCSNNIKKTDLIEAGGAFSAKCPFDIVIFKQVFTKTGDVSRMDLFQPERERLRMILSNLCKTALSRNEKKSQYIQIVQARTLISTVAGLF